MRIACVLALAASTSWCAPATAQTAPAAPTTIVPDTASDRTTGTTALQQNGTTTIDGGTRIGTNLFHSFQAFSLGTGDIAVWLRSANDGATIRNVVSRVTGGSPSSIDGTIASQGLPNADFFFINPAGIAFGANARVAVPNAVYFSTADSLSLADGGRFAATTPGGSTLTVAAPASFGFLGRGAAISIAGNSSGRFIGATNRLALSAGRIAISGSTINAGAIDLAAVGTGTGSIRIADPIGSRFGSGAITLTRSALAASVDAGQPGTIRAAADQIMLDTSSVSSFSTSRTGGGLSISAAGLSVRAQSFIGTMGNGAGQVGPIVIDAGLLDIDNAELGSRAESTGAGGPMTIRADTIRILNNGRIASFAGTQPSSTGGDIDITTRLLTIDSGGAIDSSTTGPAAGGIIAIAATTATISGNGFIDTSTFGAGDAGGLAFTADTLTLNGGQIYSNAEAESTGDAGIVQLNIGTLTLDNGQIYSNAAADSTGDAGVIQLNVDTLALRNSGEINSAAFGSGAGGLVDINAKQLSLDATSSIVADTRGTGDAGLIDIATGSATVAGLIASEALEGTGSAGGIRLVATGTLSIAPTGQITTSTFTAGDAGLVLIEANNLSIDGGAIRSVANDANVGQSGAISVTAPTVTLTNGAQIETSSANRLTAGEVEVIGTTIRVDGTGSAIFSENIWEGRTPAVNAVAGNGAAGLVSVSASRLELTNGGALSTNSLNGPAGDIVLDITPGGSVLLRGAVNSGVITTSSGPGTGGRIFISNPYLILSDGGDILALGDSAGANVEVTANFYIRSADRLNLLEVDGDLLVDSQVGDLSTGAEPIDVSFLDASAVLRGQCAIGGRGQSRFSARVTGPYAASAPPAPGTSPVAALRRALSDCRR